MDELTLREATLDELAALRQQQEKLGVDHAFGIPVPEKKAIVVPDTARLFVLQRGKDTIGFSLFVKMGSIKWELARIGLLVGERRRGIGKFLHDESIRRMLAVPSAKHISTFPSNLTFGEETTQSGAALMRRKWFMQRGYSPPNMKGEMFLKLKRPAHP